MKDNLFGKYCYIDTPGIAGKKTVYRILASDTESNTYYEVPYLYNSKPVPHGYNFERIVFVVLDTLADENSEILRFALKDVEIIDDEFEKREHGEWEYHSNPDCGVDPEDAFCSMCGFYIDRTLVDNFDNYNFCPHCGADMRERRETE